MSPVSLSEVAKKALRDLWLKAWLISFWQTLHVDISVVQRWPWQTFEMQISTLLISPIDSFSINLMYQAFINKSWTKGLMEVYPSSHVTADINQFTLTGNVRSQCPSLYRPVMIFEVETCYFASSLSHKHFHEVMVKSFQTIPLMLVDMLVDLALLNLNLPEPNISTNIQFNCI